MMKGGARDNFTRGSPPSRRAEHKGRSARAGRSIPKAATAPPADAISDAGIGCGPARSHDPRIYQNAPLQPRQRRRPMPSTASIHRQRNSVVKQHPAAARSESLSPPMKGAHRNCIRHKAKGLAIRTILV